METSSMRESNPQVRLVNVLWACDDFLAQWAGQQIDQRPEALDRLAQDAWLCSAMAGDGGYGERQSLFDGGPAVDK